MKGRLTWLWKTGWPGYEGQADLDMKGRLTWIWRARWPGYDGQPELDMKDRLTWIWRVGWPGYEGLADLDMKDTLTWLWRAGWPGYEEQADLDMKSRLTWIWRPGWPGYEGQAGSTWMPVNLKFCFRFVSTVQCKKFSVWFSHAVQISYHLFSICMIFFTTSASSLAETLTNGLTKYGCVHNRHNITMLTTVNTWLSYYKMNQKSFTKTLSQDHGNSFCWC